MSELTEVQRKALEFIHQFQEGSGHTPTLRELCSYMGYKAIGSAQDLVAALRRKGFLQIPDRQSARSLMLTDLAKDALGMLKAEVSQALSNAFLIRCLGSVPAGNPLEAISDQSQTICVSPHIFGRKRPPVDRLFGLRAKGESMKDAGILDGDWLVVQSQQDAHVGEIVVARMSDDATVKRLMRDPSRGWFLKPENATFDPIYADEHPFEIVGRVVGLQRSLS